MKPANSARVLDARSRAVVLRLAVQLFWFAGIAALPALAGRSTPAQMLAAIGSFCSFAGFFRALIALHRRAVVGAAWLNDWDECLAMVGLAALADAAARLFGGI